MGQLTEEMTIVLNLAKVVVVGGRQNLRSKRNLVLLNAEPKVGQSLFVLCASVFEWQ